MGNHAHLRTDSDKVIKTRHVDEVLCVLVICRGRLQYLLDGGLPPTPPERHTKQSHWVFWAPSDQKRWVEGNAPKISPVFLSY